MSSPESFGMFPEIFCEIDLKLEIFLSPTFEIFHFLHPISYWWCFYKFFLYHKPTEMSFDISMALFPNENELPGVLLPKQLNAITFFGRYIVQRNFISNGMYH